jgi:16S rRNA (guanine527-N7)-methyltransferase
MDGSVSRAAVVPADVLVPSAAALGVDLPPSVAEALVDYEALLLKWGQTYNLTALREASAVRHGHVLDCLAVVPALRRWSSGRTLRIVDVGSGGGLPGVVLAAVEGGWDVTCVDAVGKKAAFVRQAAAELGLSNVHAVHARVEALDLPPFDVVTSRAFASLSDFVGLTRRLLAPTGVWVAMKGKRPDDEIAALPAGVEVFHVEPLAVPGLDAERCLVWMRAR